MKFVVNLETLIVTVIPKDKEFNSLEGVKNNGQHYQLPGHALVEFRLPGDEMLLWHPQTECTSGHVDIWYSPFRKDGLGVSLCQYSGHAELDFSNETEVKQHWPSGTWNLVNVIAAVEAEMARTIGYRPRIIEWVEYQFRQQMP